MLKTEGQALVRHCNLAFHQLAVNYSDSDAKGPCKYLFMTDKVTVKLISDTFSATCAVAFLKCFTASGSLRYNQRAVAGGSASSGPAIDSLVRHILT